MPACRELRDIPPLEPNCSFQLCMRVEDRGFIVYEANPFTQTAFTGYALLELAGCRALRTGGPNDEALRRHPLYPFGLKPYCAQEVLDSPWPAEHEDLTYLGGHALRGDRPPLRHLVFALKEDMIEALATGLLVRGPFEDPTAAFREVLELCSERLRAQ